ncbi:hypothetical protein BDA99DRAFT_511918 [Phascolomyces articulosus]|uniref:VHS domain-containing protein n=1 Tax=Phascolomyces articulosus TaxID=60185 RepID=A0AAD5JZF5_9FUNG|nr:hypothetical protein BDA99DRAFT_511918 [Phascolomyces articulosus]
MPPRKRTPNYFVLSTLVIPHISLLNDMRNKLSSLLLSEKNQQSEINELVRSIDQATDSQLEQEDWQLIIQICNKVIRISNGPKTTRKLLQKKLTIQHHPQTHILALSLLRAISENCNEFDDQLQDKGLLKDLTTLWNDSNTHIHVRQKLTECMQLWMVQYRHKPTMQPLVEWCATTTCRMTAPPDPFRMGYQEEVATTTTKMNHSQQEEPLLRRWKSTITKGGMNRQKKEKNNIQRRSFVDNDEKEDLFKVQQLILQEAKTTAEFLSQLLISRQQENNKPFSHTQEENELIQEIYQKCKDLHATLMRYIEDARNTVQISTLIDVNSILVSTLETYHHVMPSPEDLMMSITNHDDDSIRRPVTILSDKALGKRPVRQKESST